MKLNWLLKRKLKILYLVEDFVFGLIDMRDYKIDELLK
jgi:hypothetical protein